MNESSDLERSEKRDSDEVGRSGEGARVSVTRKADRRDLDIVKAIKGRYSPKAGTRL